jgi:hypothetical protein
MKTLIVILGLTVGIAMGANAQTSTQAKPQSKPQTTTQPATQSQNQQAAAQSKSMIKVTELSKPIQENLSSQFKGWTAMQAYKLDTKGTISYEVLVKKEANEMRLFYDNAGKYLREEPVAAATSSTNKSTTTPPKHETHNVQAPHQATKH